MSRRSTYFLQDSSTSEKIFSLDKSLPLMTIALDLKIDSADRLLQKTTKNYEYHQYPESDNLLV